MQYDCLTGPKFSQLDATLTKDFAVTERVRMELKMAAYNATNSLNRAGPNTDINSSQFGTGSLPGHAGGQLRRANSGTRQHHGQAGRNRPENTLLGSTVGSAGLRTGATPSSAKYPPSEVINALPPLKFFVSRTFTPRTTVAP